MTTEPEDMDGTARALGDMEDVEDPKELADVAEECPEPWDVEAEE